MLKIRLRDLVLKLVAAVSMYVSIYYSGCKYFNGRNMRAYILLVLT